MSGLIITFTRSRYHRMLVLVLVGMLITSMLLAGMLSRSGPRVRIVTMNKEVQLSRGTSITLAFDRPLEKKDYKAEVSLNPAVPLETSVKGKSLIVSIQANLLQNTHYELKVNPEIYDTSGHKMAKTYTYAFISASARYMYVRRDYEMDTHTIDKKDDILFLADLTGATTELFHVKRIRMFRANRQYAVVVSDEGGSDVLYTINIKTKAVRRYPLDIQGEVRDLELSPLGTIALFSVQPEFRPDDPEYFDTYAYRLQALDIASGNAYLVNDGSGDALKVETIAVNNDGQYALIKDVKRSFFIVSPYNDFAPVLLGIHARSHGFDADSKTILFEDEGTISSYDISTSTATVRPMQDIILGVDESRGSIFAQVAEYSNGVYATKIKRSPSWSAPFETVWEPSGFTDKNLVRAFYASYDQRFIAVQLNTENCQFDDYGTSSECEDVSMILYDTKDKKELGTIKGFGLVWLP